MFKSDDNRISSYKKNIVFSIVNKLFMLFFPFISRTCLIHVLGIEYVGLNGLFSSILQMLNMAELGFGTAMVYSMYKPIAENDTKTLSALLLFYKKIYRSIGLFIVTVGLCVIPFINFLVKDGYPKDINIYVLYMIFLLNTSVSYFLYAYRSAVLSAYQKSYISSWVSMGCYSVIYILQILVLITTKSYYFYVILTPVATIAVNLINGLISKKLYPNITCEGRLDQKNKKDIFQSVKALFLHKIGNMLIYSCDSIVISAILGLRILGIYNNYYYVYNAIAGFFSICYSSITASIGSSLILDNKDKIVKDFSVFTFANTIVTGICTSVLLCLFQDFITIWTGRENTLSDISMLLMVLYFYVWHSRRIVHTYKDAAGLWSVDKFRPIVEGILNLILNIILVKFIGINGVMISTIVSMAIIGMPWESKILIKDYFGISLKKYWMEQFKYFIVALTISGISFFLCQVFYVSNYIALVLKTCVCVVLIILFYFIAYIKDSKIIKIKEIFLVKLWKK